MKRVLHAIVAVIDALNERIGQAVSWVTTILVVLVCIDVVMRYLFQTTYAWVIELEWHLFALIFLLGAGYALKHNRHVRVDLFYAKFSPRDKAWVDLLGTILFLIPWCLVVIVTSFHNGMASLEINETSPEPNGLPALYLIKFAVTAGFILLLLQALAVASRAILLLTNKENN